jgi:hypothetical protein
VHMDLDGACECPQYVSPDFSIRRNGSNNNGYAVVRQQRRELSQTTDVVISIRLAEGEFRPEISSNLFRIEHLHIDPGLSNAFCKQMRQGCFTGAAQTG